jgi:tripartite ATP-independent transporter DctM subunit
VATSPRSRGLARAEDIFAGLVFLLMAGLPLAEFIVRQFDPVGIPGSLDLVKHLALWVGFLGAAIAAREGKLLTLATGTLLPAGPVRAIASLLSAITTAAVCGLLVWGAIELVINTRDLGSTIGAEIPTWITQLVLPASFMLIAARVIRLSSPTWQGRAIASLGLVVPIVLFYSPEMLEGATVWPFALVLVASAVLGAPIFVLLGGLAVVFFLSEAQTPYIVLRTAYSLAASDAIPAIPLFTLAGFLLAEGRSSERLLRVFRAWFGWIPGGTAVVCAALCSFFTVFTGGSGVTILALGGLLMPALLKEGYRERFSLGLLTASGSLGLLLPPALPLLVYAIVAQVPIESMFIGGLLPGLLMTTLIAAWGVREGLISGATRTTFTIGEGLASLWSAKWELMMPGVVLGSLFYLYMSTVEAAAMTAMYALIVQTAIHREITIRRNLFRVLMECLTIVGGVLIIIGVAMGFTRYIVGAGIPAAMLEWTQAYVSSALMFLFLLNLFLLVVGCLMDIFAATVVIVPLIVPIGLAYGIHPVHLGVIFIANLELGYLTPPVGLNLFLSSYRFKKPVMEVARASLPMLGILAVGVLLITYVPWLTVGLLEWLGRS